ncbi:DUF5721 family protein [Bariatricus massiliensis]|uniref:DUF5721 family protein n=1 Tax=Bariatricus massiliensis TaxID=1745713 RepID=A0ABS8DDU0_9FIRM|nr:DUF5721 family protein [Bariatricus massiliensis]MCB7302694.1 DUF5721 family protein [Bariatricus massiliensis]MCB7373910.1 DUF5721 family protein [Bariatricus massiliensis]MCB7386580.1 DUF5721 family protein [Bariatricus massiliensis]MCB7410742.1 DUF5721 family protein [Bariatricus massiliensis]MCQ5253419.1 DUF5721 family protein [Bariatricus massiliensis]
MLIFSLDTKKCMNKLLLQSTFDSFLFIEGEITTFNTFHIDGRLKKEFFRQDEEASASVMEREYSLWKDVREYCFSLIKGRRTPLGFKLVFSLSAPNIERLLAQEDIPFTLSDVQGLYLNFKYNGTVLTCTTGTSMHTFTMDKSLEQAWDKMVQKFLTKHEIPYEGI